MLASWVFRWQLRRFLAACDDPFTAQAARLRAILRAAAHTGIGEAADFGALARAKDAVAMIEGFQARIPVRTHEAMRPDLEAVYEGEWRRLCPTPPAYFALTAGSTGKYKYIPVTAGSRREIGQGSLIYYGALEDRFPGLKRKRCQFLVGSAEGGVSPTGVPQGFASGHNYKHLPGFIRRRFVLPYWLFTLPDAGERAYAAARGLVSARDLGALCAITPLNLIELRRSLEHDPERLCTDIARGTLTLSAQDAPLPWGAPDPALAEALATARRREGRFPTALLFPALEVLVCWQGGNMGYYRASLAEEFGAIPQHEFPISASEALFALPVRDVDVGGTLAVTSHFLEFIAADGSGVPSAPLRADQLTSGRTYRIVVTTSGGLYRYDMEDLVEVTGRCGRTPVIRFVAKAGRRTSVANERLGELDVTEAMTAVGRQLDLWLPSFLLVPCSDRRYRLLVDGGFAPHGSLDALAPALDQALCAASTGYAFEREDALLHPVEVMITAPGELAGYLARVTAGPALPNAQRKPLHLTTTFDLHATFTAAGVYAIPAP